MRYFAMFEGIGGFTKGIEEGYGRFQRHQILHGHQSDAFISGINERTSSGNGETYPTCVGVSEIDRYASAIYKYHYPNHQNYGDATKLICESIPDFDLLTGGFPCQAFSIAGKRQGFAEDRGTLFFEIARILSHKRPRYFLLENVKGLLSHDSGKTYLTIIGILADLGYFVETVVLNSKDFGVPQNRERIFFVGHLAEPGRSPRPILPFGQDGELFNNSGNTDERRSQAKYSTSLKASGAVKADDTFIAEQARNPKKQVVGKDIATCLDASYYKGAGPKDLEKGLRQMVRGNEGLHKSDMDLIQVGNLYENKAEGGRVYSPDGVIRQLQANGGGMGAKTGLYVVPEATKQGYAIAEPGDSINLAVPNNKTRRGRVGKGVANTLETSCNQATVQGQRIRRLTPIECERLQKFEDRWTEKGLFENGEVKAISDTQRYRCLGNAVTVSVIAWLVERILIHAENGGE